MGTSVISVSTHVVFVTCKSFLTWSALQTMGTPQPFPYR